MDIVRMGELRVCGKPIVLGEQYTGGPITIEDTPPIGGMEFFELNKSFFVSTQVWLPQVSWWNLERSGLNLGIFVKIGGRHYICRMPYVGDLNGDPNEWDDLLTELNKQELELVNQQGFSFWGKDAAKAGAKNNWNNRIIRGGYAAAGRGERPVNFANHRLGFRPVLMRLPPEPELSSIQGHNVSIFGPCGTSVAGQLICTSDYDIVLRPITAVPGAWSEWSRKDGNEVIIERGNVKYVKEEK